MPFKEKSAEVYVADGEIVEAGPREVAFLKSKLASAPRGRVRLCAHRDGSDPLHEMLIALDKRTYIRPHKHLAKSESFHVIEGVVDVVLFSDDGKIARVLALGDPASGRNFFYRLAGPAFHTLIIRSEILIIHETTNGPFRQGDAIFADWAPEESQTAQAKAYMDSVEAAAAKFAR